MMRSLFISFLLFATCTASAFQFADGTKTVTSLPNTKYILYWGQHQCDLTEASGYKGNLSLSPAGFRQMLLHAPTIWDGVRLIRDFEFTLDGERISTENYTSRLGNWDALFGAKATFRNVFHATDLPLGNNVTGSLDILIINPEEKEEPKPSRGYWASNTPFLNSILLEQVVWGREDIIKNTDRDFFSVSDFWQTVRQQPFVEWKYSVLPQTLRAGVSFQSPEHGTFSVFANLPEYNEYVNMLDNLYNYKHLARPGSTVSLILETAERYEQLYRKQMIIVADNDPRLLLRRNRDTHSLTFEWGDYKTKLDGLYLSTFVNSEGNMTPIDEPVSRIDAIRHTDSTIAEMFGARPRCFVDGNEVSGFSFRLTVADSNYELGDDKPLPETVPSVDFSDKIAFELDSFNLNGYTLPKMNFTLHFVTITNDLLVRNDFETLTKTASDPAMALMMPPVITKDSIEITFKIPKEAIAKISLFGPEGLLDHLVTDKFPAGENKVSIARSQARSEGKHFIFLNTPFGVLKQEIELK